MKLYYTLVAIALAIIVGWVMNIISLVGADSITGMEIARIAGIFIPPLGGVLGYL